MIPVDSDRGAHAVFLVQSPMGERGSRETLSKITAAITKARVVPAADGNREGPSEQVVNVGIALLWFVLEPVHHGTWQLSVVWVVVDRPSAPPNAVALEFSSAGLDR